MKYLKMFEGYQSESEVEKICNRYGIKNWLLVDGLVNVDGDVPLWKRGLTELPLKFGTVTGHFDCSENKLTSLEGCPNRVGGNFSLRENNLRSLVGCPIQVGGSFDCDGNNLTSLVGCPNRVGSWFSCNRNKLTSLVGCPRSVGGSFHCEGNKIREFTGIKYIGGSLYCFSNPIGNIWDIISPNLEWDEDQMDLFEDLSVIQDDGEAVAIDRLNFFLEEIGLDPVEKVDGYINI